MGGRYTNQNELNYLTAWCICLYKLQKDERRLRLSFEKIKSPLSLHLLKEGKEPD
jgi:hypothetical protein